MMRKGLVPLGLLLSLGIVWSLGYSIARYCMTHGVSPLGYSFWQSFGPAAVLGFLMLMSRTPFRLSSRHLSYYVFCAIAGIALPNSIIHFAARHLTSELLAIVVNTVPILTYPLAVLAQQEKFQWTRLIAVLIGCVGIFWLILSTAPNVSFHTLLTGETGWALLTLIAPLSFACCSIFIAKQRNFQDAPLALSFGMLACSTVFLTPFVIKTHSFYFFHFPMNFNDVLVITEIGLSSLGYVILFALLKYSGAVYYSMVGGIVAIAGMIWGKLFFGESFPPIVYLPVALIFVAIVGLHFFNHRKP